MPDDRPMMPTPIGAAPVIRTLREMLEAAAAARRCGDSAAADAFEVDALLLLRSTIQPKGEGAQR